MNWVLFLCLISLSSFAFADERKYDFDKNGKPDFIEIYRDGKLVESHYDSDADGKFDRHVFLDPESDVFKIVDILPTKKQLHRRITYTNSEIQGLTFAHVELDKNHDGVFETTYDLTTELNQNRDTCSVTTSASAENLAGSALAACARAEDFTETDFGYRVHNSCLQKNWFLPLMRESITTGMACLTELSQSGMRGAARNLASLEGLFANSKVQVICNETSYNWGTSTLAHATTGTENAARDLPLVHPAISIGPSVLNAPQTPENVTEFKRTFFHEQLHNLGYRHGTDPEISYTCELCCFSDATTSAESKNSACRACGGDYSGITDPQYLSDITEFGRLNYTDRQGRAASLAYLRENHNDNLGLAYLAANAGGIFSSTGSELSRLLSARTDLTPEEREIVERTQQQTSFYQPLAAYRPGGNVVARAYVSLYRDHNPEAALALLRQNANLLRRQMALRQGENGRFMAENLKDNIDNMIYDIWIRGYRGQAPVGTSSDPLGRSAYDVKNLLGM